MCILNLSLHFLHPGVGSVYLFRFNTGVSVWLITKVGMSKIGPVGWVWPVEPYHSSPMSLTLASYAALSGPSPVYYTWHAEPILHRLHIG